MLNQLGIDFGSQMETDMIPTRNQKSMQNMIDFVDWFLEPPEMAREDRLGNPWGLLKLVY